MREHDSVLCKRADNRIRPDSSILSTLFHELSFVRLKTSFARAKMSVNPIVRVDPTYAAVIANKMRSLIQELGRKPTTSEAWNMLKR